MQKGFTLLELLVVLVIVAMTASFAGPSLWKSYVKSNERSLVYAFADSLGAMRQNAFHQGRSVSLPALNEGSIMNHDKFPVLPEGWMLERSTALRFLPSGVTNGASFYLSSPVGNRWQLSLAPLDGRVGIHRL
ncbi:prepilin-type N-terminal cleavage/methylation domain-containing protein [Mariprofundus ferrooxydans]|nr:prepilin-type N-terminal cleavage/methylation domain-containing protein [Mariprofundus ferrooxydans]